MVIYEVNGQTRMRSKPGQVKDPKTPKQMAQRGRMKGVAALFQQLDYQLYVFWKELTEGTTMNAYNLFMSRNIRHLDKDGKVADPSQLVVCQGDLPGAAELEIKETEDGCVEILWNGKEQDGERKTDRLQIAVYTPEHKKGNARIWMAAEQVAERRAGRYVWQLPEVKGAVYAYGFFRGRYLDDISESFYIGTFGETEVG